MALNDLHIFNHVVNRNVKRQNRQDKKNIIISIFRMRNTVFDNNKNNNNYN